MKKQPGRKAGGKLLDRTVFGFFDNFSNTDGEVRVRGACDLIEFLHKDGGKTTNKKTGPTVNGTPVATASSKTAEKAYALKRLVRGVGSPSNASKTGYYTALVGFLQRAGGQDDCPTITELFGLVKSELADSEHDPSESVDAKERNRFEVRLGKVLVCGAIIKAGLIEKASDSELQTVLSTLRAAMYKMLVPLVWTHLNEVAARISGAKFAKLFWPLFEPVLNVPKEQHTMDSVYFLVLLLDGPHREMVNKKYFVRNFGAPSLLHERAFPYLGELLFGIESAMGINHPFFNCLLEKLLKMEAAAVVGFWRDGVVPVLEKDDEERPKYRDIVLPQLIASWFIRLKDHSVVPELLCPAMMKLFVANLQQLGKFSEDVRSLYLEACKAIVETYPKLGEESVRLATYRCLTQAPSSILIEKYASCKLLQNLLATLSVANLKMVAGELKAIVIDDKRPTVERAYAAHMIQRLLTLKQLTATDETGSSQPDEWRADMVHFFFTLGVFYSANGVTVLKPSKHDSAAPQELASTVRGLFFHSLEHRHANLAGEHDFLLSIVRRVQETLQSHGGKSLRAALSEEQMASWDRMYAKVTETSDVQSKKSSKKRPSAAEGQDKLKVVFHLLLMQMGLHLFSELTELAHSSIVELECVMKRLDVKAKQRRQRPSAGTEEAMEPEWIEVVVDLFLNLLSQNSLLLRKVIGHVFPHLSGSMTLAAFNQILSVVNLKDKTNPLAAQGDAEDGEAESDEGESEEDDDNGDEADTANGKNDSDDEDEEDDDELMGDEEEEETISDKMRQAVQAALGGANPETDTESLDLDEIDEEQGHRLDVALAEAFRSFRNGRKQGGKQKPTKAELQMDTVLTHFRMRVFDLIDAYLKHAGPDMAICLELLVYVFEMLPVAIREETKYGAILNRYRQIFAALTRIKQFRSVAPAVQLNQILRDLIDKVAKGAQFPERNQYLLKACQFIVLCSQLLEKHNDAPRTNGTATVNGTESESSVQVDKVFGKLLTEFLTHRHPPIAFSVFQNLFRMSWTGNWYLAVTLTSTGLQVNTIRGQRRTQALQLLRELLKNRRFINSDLPRAAPSLRTICIALTKYLADLEGTMANGDAGAGERTIGQSELYELLQVLLEMHSLLNSLRQPGQEEAKKKPMLRWERIGAQVQSLRRFNLNSQTMASYRQLCQRLQLTPIANGEVTVPKVTKENGTSGKKQSKKESKKLLSNGKAHADEEQQEEPSTLNGGDEEELATEEQPKRKRKKKDQAEGPETSSKKEKRRRKEARLQVASQGMEAVSFV